MLPARFFSFRASASCGDGIALLIYPEECTCSVHSSCSTGRAEIGPWCAPRDIPTITLHLASVRKELLDIKPKRSPFISGLPSPLALDLCEVPWKCQLPSSSLRIQRTMQLISKTRFTYDTLVGTLSTDQQLFFEKLNFLTSGALISVAREQEGTRVFCA